MQIFSATGRWSARCGFIILVAGLVFSLDVMAQEVIVYGGSGSRRGADEFRERASSIDVIAPQVYAVDSLGNVRGGVPQRLLEDARETNTRLMPLIMNPGFNQEIIHALLNDPEAQQRTIDFMVAEGVEYGYWGWQFDYENIDSSYKDRFTEYFRNAAKALQANGMTASVAVVPTNDQAAERGFSRYMQANWRGNFDMPALAEAGDFISLMTYAQHGGPTAPGPITGLPWMREMLDYALDQGVPIEKISIGLPFYSGYWHPDEFPNGAVRVRGNEVQFRRADSLLAAHNAERIWLEEHGVTYGFWPEYGVFHWVFLENTRSMQAKLDVVAEYPGLRGVSIWVLGAEDPGVWPLLDAAFPE